MKLTSKFSLIFNEVLIKAIASRLGYAKLTVMCDWRAACGQRRMRAHGPLLPGVLLCTVQSFMTLCLGHVGVHASCHVRWYDCNRVGGLRKSKVTASSPVVVVYRLSLDIT